MPRTVDLRRTRDTFQHQGFVVVPDLLSPDELAELRGQIKGVLDGSIQPTDAQDRRDFDIQWEPRVRDREDLPRREKIRAVFHMAHRHPAFWRWATEPRLLDVVEALLGPNLRFYTDQMFVKPAHHGSEVPWHQDAAYWPAVEPHMLSCWLAIDDVTIANGCVRFIPGSHAQPLPHHTIETDNPNKTTTRPEHVDPAKEVPVEMRAGSVCIHHSLTVHRSLPNTSDHARRGWVLIYLPADLTFHRPWNFEHGFKLVRGHAEPAI